MHNKGFTLIEVMIAMGLTMGLALALVAMMDGSNRSMRAVGQGNDYADFRNTLDEIWSNPQTCTQIHTQYINPTLTGGAFPNAFSGLPFLLPGPAGWTIPTSDRASGTVALAGAFTWGKISILTKDTSGGPATFLKALGAGQPLVFAGTQFNFYTGTLSFSLSKTLTEHANNTTSAAVQTLGAPTYTYSKFVAFLTEQVGASEYLVACGNNVTALDLAAVAVTNANNHVFLMQSSPRARPSSIAWMQKFLGALWIPDAVAASASPHSGKLSNPALQAFLRSYLSQPIACMQALSAVNLSPLTALGSHTEVSILVASQAVAKTSALGGVNLSSVKLQMTLPPTTSAGVTSYSANLILTDTSAASPATIPLTIKAASGNSRVSTCQSVGFGTTSGAKTWTDVLAARSNNTEYVNTYSYEISISVTAVNSAFKTAYFKYRTDAASPWMTMAVFKADPPKGHNDSKGQFFMNVPPGGHYMVQADSHIETWLEYY